MGKCPEMIRFLVGLNQQSLARQFAPSLCRSAVSNHSHRGLAASEVNHEQSTQAYTDTHGHGDQPVELAFMLEFDI